MTSSHPGELVDLQEDSEIHDSEKPFLVQANTYIEDAQRCLQKAIEPFADEQKSVVPRQFRDAIQLLQMVCNHISSLNKLLDNPSHLPEPVLANLGVIRHEFNVIKDLVDTYALPSLSRKVHCNFSSLKNALDKVAQYFPGEE